jgi:hypothetical protein
MSKKRYQSEKLNVIEEELNTLFTAEFLENHTSGHFLQNAQNPHSGHSTALRLFPAFGYCAGLNRSGR